MYVSTLYGTRLAESLIYHLMGSFISFFSRSCVHRHFDQLIGDLVKKQYQGEDNQPRPPRWAQLLSLFLSLSLSLSLSHPLTFYSLSPSLWDTCANTHSYETVVIFLLFHSLHYQYYSRRWGAKGICWCWALRSRSGGDPWNGRLWKGWTGMADILCPHT